MNASEVRTAGAGLPRRLRRNAGDVVFILAALVLGYFLWPTSLGGCTTLTIVSGHSMEPTYYTGDLVVSRCGGYAVGDVVVYNPPNVGSARVIHRIVGGDATAGWVVKGDNNDYTDPWQPTDSRVFGKAVLHLPKVGLLGSVLVSPMTWISLFLIAGAILVWPSPPERPPSEDVEPDAGAGEGPAGLEPEAPVLVDAAAGAARAPDEDLQ